MNSVGSIIKVGDNLYKVIRRYMWDEKYDAVKIKDAFEVDFLFKKNEGGGVQYMYLCNKIQDAEIVEEDDKKSKKDKK